MDKLEIVNIGDIEIFEAGNYNGVEMTEGDIDELILNYKSQVTEPYITIDHSEEATGQFKDALKAMSLGFVSDLKRVGKKVIADFKQVPKTLATLIQAGALKKKSIEFYKKYIHANGDKYDNVLQGVTFHGANGSPAVTTLSDFINLYKNELMTSDNIVDTKNKMTSLKIKEEKIMADENKFEVELVSLKKDHEVLSNEMTTLKAENDALKLQVTESGETLTQLKKIEAEYTVFKKSAEDKAEADLTKEAEDYVKGQIDLKKIIPNSKDMYEKNYITFKKESDEALQLFKDDIEKRADLLKTDSVVGDNKDDIKKLKVDAEHGESNIDDLIEHKMKNEGKTFEVARKEIYAAEGLEV